MIWLMVYVIGAIFCLVISEEDESIKITWALLWPAVTMAAISFGLILVLDKLTRKLFKLID